MADGRFELPPPSTVSFVGREKERAALTGALRDVKSGRGQTWIVEGPAGIGKTQLVRWLEEEAVKGGFRVHWGYCLKESNAPFFPFQQIFRHSGFSPAVPDSPSHPGSETDLPLISIYEDERPARLLNQVAVLTASHPSLLVSRDRLANLHKTYPSIPPDTKVLQLTKSGEGADCVAPGQVDAIGERLSQHLRSAPGAVVVLTGLDYLVSQNGFTPVLRLVQFLREEAEAAGAHVLISVNPATLEKREMALLEGEGEVLREEAVQTPPLPSTPEPPADTMLRYLDHLEREAPGQPRMLVLDDVQWADPDSLRTLEFLARNARSLPVMLVGTMRVEEWRTSQEQAEHVLDDILGKIDEEGSLSRLSLRGLDDRESQILAERTIGLPMRRGEGASDSALLDIFQRAEGNPYFVQETMRQLVQEGLLRREGDHAVLTLPTSGDGTSPGQTPPIPPTLRRLVVRRLSMLTAEEMDLLRWAAVAGSEFDLAPVVAALHRPGNEVSALLHRLEHDLHILDPLSGGERWSFGHPLVWEATLAETDSEDLRRRSLGMADWWAEHQPGDVGSVARLYHDSLEPGRGVPWVRKALDQAILTHASETVVRYHRWLQDLLKIAGVEPRVRMQEGMSVCERHLLRIGSGAPLSNMLETLVHLTLPPPELFPARILLAYSVAGGNIREALAQIGLVEKEMSQENVSLAPKWNAIKMLVNLGALVRQGQFRAALEEIQRLSPLISDVEEPWVNGRVLYTLGHCSAQLGQLTEAKKALSDLQELTRTSGESFLEIFGYGLEAAIASIEGDLKRGEEGQSRAQVSARQRGDMRSTATALGNLVVTGAFRGDFPAARANLSEGRKICERFGFTDTADHLSVGECFIFWAEGRWPEVVEKLRERVSTSVGNQTGRALAHLLLAESYLEVGEPSKARTSLGEAERRKGELEPGEAANILRVRARLEEAEGHLDAGRRSLEEGLRILEVHPNMYWGAWIHAEMARWESRLGDPTRASSFRHEAESLFDKSGVLPAGKPAWLERIPP